MWEDMSLFSLLPESRLISRRSCEAQGCKEIQLPGSTGGEGSSAQSLEKKNGKIKLHLIIIRPLRSKVPKYVHLKLAIPFRVTVMSFQVFCFLFTLEFGQL